MQIKMKLFTYNYCSKVNYYQNSNLNKRIIYSVTPKEKRKFENIKILLLMLKKLYITCYLWLKVESYMLWYIMIIIYVSLATDYLQSYNNDFIKLSLFDLFENKKN